MPPRLPPKSSRTILPGPSQGLCRRGRLRSTQSNFGSRDWLCTCDGKCGCRGGGRGLVSWGVPRPSGCSMNMASGRRGWLRSRPSVRRPILQNLQSILLRPGSFASDPIGLPRERSWAVHLHEIGEPAGTAHDSDEPPDLPHSPDSRSRIAAMDPIAMPMMSKRRWRTSQHPERGPAGRGIRQSCHGAASSLSGHSASPMADRCGAASRNRLTAEAIDALSRSPTSKSANRSKAASWSDPTSIDTDTRPCRRRDRLRSARVLAPVLHASALASSRHAFPDFFHCAHVTASPRFPQLAGMSCSRR
jgi:hypothetical protein